MEKTVLIGLVALFAVVAMPGASADVTLYLSPQDSSVPEGYCNDTVVQLRADITSYESFYLGQIAIKYDGSCANITDLEWGPAVNSMMSAWNPTGLGCVGYGADGLKYDWIKPWFYMPQSDTDVLIANLTVHCNSTEYCVTTLSFSCGKDCSACTIEVLDSAGANLYPDHATLTDGTFTCGEPADDDCLGMCYEGTVCEGTPIEKMSCSACLAMADTSWLNDPCPVSACGCTCDSMCWNESIGGCPECCDGVDNDGVNGTDWPADPQCGCCIDGNETDGTDSCPDPCIPELPTLALAGIGILGIALLARKRD